MMAGKEEMILTLPSNMKLDTNNITLKQQDGGNFIMCTTGAGKNTKQNFILTPLNKKVQPATIARGTSQTSDIVPVMKTEQSKSSHHPQHDVFHTVPNAPVLPHQNATITTSAATKLSALQHVISTVTVPPKPSAVNRSTLRHSMMPGRALVIDRHRVIPTKIFQLQLANTDDLRRPYDMSPPTKKLMKYKEESIPEKLFGRTGLGVHSKTVLNMFKRNLVTTQNKCDINSIERVFPELFDQNSKQETQQDEGLHQLAEASQYHAQLRSEPVSQHIKGEHVQTQETNHIKSEAGDTCRSDALTSAGAAVEHIPHSIPATEVVQQTVVQACGTDTQFAQQHRYNQAQHSTAVQQHATVQLDEGAQEGVDTKVHKMEVNQDVAAQQEDSEVQHAVSVQLEQSSSALQSVDVHLQHANTGGDIAVAPLHDDEVEYVTLEVPEGKMVAVQDGQVLYVTSDPNFKAGLDGQVIYMAAPDPGHVPSLSDGMVTTLSQNSSDAGKQSQVVYLQAGEVAADTNQPQTVYITNTEPTSQATTLIPVTTQCNALGGYQQTAVVTDQSQHSILIPVNDTHVQVHSGCLQPHGGESNAIMQSQLLPVSMAEVSQGTILANQGIPVTAMSVLTETAHTLHVEPVSTLQTLSSESAQTIYTASTQSAQVVQAMKVETGASTQTVHIG